MPPCAGNYPSCKFPSRYLAGATAGAAVVFDDFGHLFVNPIDGTQRFRGRIKDLVVVMPMLAPDERAAWRAELDDTYAGLAL